MMKGYVVLRHTADMGNDRPSGPSQVIARAPGRVNLIGEHTDYNDGFVLPMALPFATTIAFEKRDDDVVELDSVGFDSTSFHLGDDPSGVTSWARYIAGMARFLAVDGLPVTGFSAQIQTDIPVGASLSSSAALEVATGFGLCGLAGVAPDPVYIAKIGQRVENEIIGIQSGIMDQLISATGVEGSVVHIDCRSLATTPVRLPSSSRVLILDTMTRRELADSEYDLRRQACERAALAAGVGALRDATLDDVLGLPEFSDTEQVDKRRAHHVVTENSRVQAAVDAIAADDLELVGQLMNDSHESLSVDYEVSSPALDEMSAIARAHDACFGARMTGGGFAGSAVALVRAEQADATADAVSREWAQRHGVTPDIWAVDPSAGASVTVNS